MIPSTSTLLIITLAIAALALVLRARNRSSTRPRDPWSSAPQSPTTTIVDPVCIDHSRPIQQPSTDPDTDHLARARSRSRIKLAAQANDLTDNQTAELVNLFEHLWQRSERRSESAAERERNVTRPCIERATSWAREYPATDFAQRV